ncbi:hypothetical protein GLYMA_04G165200v4 [Glycine max]|uniref:Uncharacterized protein n=1 Tax=Glycine max TaxID=3847 RepID=K7KKL2_SOYBN|nr:hypothetical protein GYH30_010164 [Glycine max]KRH63279.1 hypothetical protein GLYMA_04G165200v4 [Glycine max]
MKGDIFSFMVVALMLSDYDLFYCLCILLTLSNIPIRVITWTLPVTTIVFVVSCVEHDASSCLCIESIKMCMNQNIYACDFFFSG